MATHFTNTNTFSQIGANIAYDTWIIAQGTYVIVDTGSAIAGILDYNGRSFRIDGHVYGDSINGLILGTNGGATGNNLTVTDTGSLHGYSSAVRVIADDMTVINRGTMTSQSQNTVWLTTNFATVTNSGLIAVNRVLDTPAPDAVSFVMPAMDDAVFNEPYGANVTNTGQIIGANRGVFATRLLDLLNTGVIQGGNGAGVQADEDGNRITNSASGSISGGAYGIFAGFSSFVQNDGTVTATNGTGIATGATGSTGGSDMMITNNGSILATTDGIYVPEGRSSVTNNGSITADQRGIYVGQFEDVTSYNQILNRGTITAGTVGIQTAGEMDTIVNEGTILAPTAVHMQMLDGALTDLNTLENNGTLTGRTYSVRGSEGQEFVMNNGILQGNVALEAGNDIYRGENGYLSSGSQIDLGGGDDEFYGGAGRERVFDGPGDDTVEGGAGNDSFRAGTGANFYDGGDGYDYVSYYDFSTRVRIDLATGSTAGGGAGNAAGNDVLLNIEAVGGTNGGNDTLYGDEGRNSLFGWGGNDNLYGRGGNDKLDGGAGDDFFDGGAGSDQLFGGLGADRFELDRGEGDDVINDFEDDIDTIRFDNFAYLSNAADALTYATQVGNDVYFNFGSDGSLLVLGVTMAQLANDIDIV